ncbi:MAG: hypothetical protein CL743_04990 [Chloroflexi bacterium]|nr:hypothetical protein [Chloroflexota bacterium]
MTTLQQAIIKFQSELSSIGADNPRLEADLIWMNILNVSRAELFGYSQHEAIKKSALIKARSLLNRRLKNEPLAYIIGSKEFYGLKIKTSPKALIPRPETEVMVDEALEYLSGKEKMLIADVGCGTAAISIAIAKNNPSATLYALDISKKALHLAKANILMHQLENQIELIQSNLLTNLPHPVDMLLANLPYIPTTQLPYLQSEVQLYEPLIALNGGIDGLEIINTLLQQAKYKLLPQGVIFLEIDPSQVKKILSLASDYFPSLSYNVVNDLTGRSRVIVLKPNSVASNKII